MYNRQYGQRRPPNPPQNYSGNAFYRVPQVELPPPPPQEEAPELPLIVEDEPIVHDKEDERSAPSTHEQPQRSPLPLFGGKLFPRGLGSEELLILALILMTAQSEDQNDILLYLILLLFC